MTQNQLIASNDEDARMVTFPTGQFINRNPLAILFNFNEFRVSKTMVDLLSNLNDPRLPVYAAPVASSNPPVYRGLQNRPERHCNWDSRKMRANFSNMGETISGRRRPD